MEKANFVVPGNRNQKEEREDSGWVKAQPLPDVRALREANIVLDLYRELYETRYGSKPVFHNIQAVTTTFKDIIRKVQPEPLSRVLAMTKQFMRTDNDYYKRRAHAPDVFLKDIQAISAATKPEQPAGARRGLMVNIDTQCPTCNAWFKLDVNTNEIERKFAYTKCKSCQESGR